MAPQHWAANGNVQNAQQLAGERPGPQCAGLWGKLVLPASPCRIEKSTRHHVRRSASTKLEKASATRFCTNHTEWRLTLMMRGTLGMAVTSYPAQQTHGKAQPDSLGNGLPPLEAAALRAAIPENHMRRRASKGVERKQSATPSQAA